jgi:unsaturated rhamnogalacturonyl hydrolase
MKRREFINKTGVLSAGIMMANYACSTEKLSPHYKRHPVTSVAFPDIKYPEGKRIPLGWKAMPVAEVSKGQSTVIYFKGLKARELQSPVFLRLTAAIDFREEKQVRVFLPESGKEIGLFKMWFAHPFQPFEMPIEETNIEDIIKEGIALSTTKGTGAAWFYMPDTSNDANLGLQPHLLSGKSKDLEKSFFDNLYSMNSFSPFGWMGGSVQDALLELHLQGNKSASEILKMHLESYLDNEKGIRFENPHTIPLDGTFNSIEDFLPFTSIAHLYPEHISIDKALKFMLEKKHESGIISGGQITTEGCYTLAYPLAAIAVLRKDAGLAQISLDQLIHRMKFLTDEKAVYQRASSSGKKSYQNWGRGVTWYLLGLIKTMRILESSDFNNLQGKEEIYKSFVKCAGIAVSHQDGHGMWHSYIDRHQTGVDTSATGGIAAAIAWGCKQGILDKDYLNLAEKAYQSLIPYLSADGFLREVSQINRGGEDLQESNYWVITQFGMGLMAQLRAALDGNV